MPRDVMASYERIFQYRKHCDSVFRYFAFKVSSYDSSTYFFIPASQNSTTAYKIYINDMNHAACYNMALPLGSFLYRPR